jgi:hypothetical protein
VSRDLASDAGFPQPNPALAPPVAFNGGFTSPDSVLSATWTVLNKIVSFEVTVNLAGDYWGAVGFNPVDSMVGGDIIIGYVSSSNIATVSDRHATDHAEPLVDSVQSLTGISGTRTSQSTVFRFSRPLTTGDPDDADLQSSVFFLWAYGQYNAGSGQISQHISKGTVVGLSFSSDCVDYGASRSATLAASTAASLVPVHALLMVLAFACLSPLASVAAAARLSGFKQWFIVHMIANFVALASAVAGFVIIFVSKSGTLTVGVHQIMGVIVFGLFILQSALGLVSHFMYDSTRTSVPFFPDRVHHWYGRVLTVAAVVTMFFGVNTLSTLYGLPSPVAPYVLLAVLVASSAAFYILLLVRGAKEAPVSRGYNMGSGDDISVSSSPGSASATRLLFAIACIAGLALYGGFVVTLYVPSYKYGSGGAVPARNALTTPSKGCFSMNKYALPAQQTTYACRGFVFPNSPAQQAYHFSPSIDNAGVVHHMILFRTTSYLGDAAFQCPAMPPGSSPFWAWAVGGDDFVAPSNTGFNAASYFALQVHYTNPNSLSTLVDSSGVKVSFTPTPFPDTSVFLELGVATGKISLPPKQTIHLSSTCSAAIVPAGASALIWANGLHAHLRGRKIWIEHLRNGANIGYIGCDLFYDFNKQHFEMRNATLQRGDQMKIHCQYDTSAETAVVVGGEATTNGTNCICLTLFDSLAKRNVSRVPLVLRAGIPEFQGRELLWQSRAGDACRHDPVLYVNEKRSVLLKGRGGSLGQPLGNGGALAELRVKLVQARELLELGRRGRSGRRLRERVEHVKDGIVGVRGVRLVLEKVAALQQPLQVGVPAVDERLVDKLGLLLGCSARDLEVRKTNVLCRARNRVQLGGQLQVGRVDELVLARQVAQNDGSLRDGKVAVLQDRKEAEIGLAGGLELGKRGPLEPDVLVGQLEVDQQKAHLFAAAPSVEVGKLWRMRSRKPRKEEKKKSPSF